MTVPRERLASLDVFRGVTVAAMILVNNPGDWNSVYPPLLHAYWTGWTFADLIFPSFLFVMGAAIPFAFARRRDRGHDVREMHRRILVRTAALFALGLALSAVTTWTSGAPLRIPGVLQRLALAYLIAAVIVLHGSTAAWAGAVATLVAAHWALLMLVPFGGLPAGTLTPQHNLARFIDTAAFGRHALSIPIDPEGMLGTLTAAATVLTGALAGAFLRRPAPHSVRLAVLGSVGAIGVCAGIALSHFVPISKPLWTGSFVVLSTGLTLLAFAVVYLIVDAASLARWGRPFQWLGMNPLAIYVASEFVGHLIEAPWLPEAHGRTTIKAALFWRHLAPLVHPAERASLVFGMAFVTVWIVVAGALSRRRIYVRV